MGSDSSQVSHGWYPEASAERPSELRCRQVYLVSKFLQAPAVFGTRGKEPCRKVAIVGYLWEASLTSSVAGLRVLVRFDAHRRRLPSRCCAWHRGGEDPVVLNRSTHAVTGRSFGSAVAAMRWRSSHAVARCEEPRVVL